VGDTQKGMAMTGLVNEKPTAGVDGAISLINGTRKYLAVPPCRFQGRFFS